jgi:hypothetical protein
MCSNNATASLQLLSGAKHLPRKSDPVCDRALPFKIRGHSAVTGDTSRTVLTYPNATKTLTAEPA